jgi:uncharacterized protein
MLIAKNIMLAGPHGKPILTDIFYAVAGGPRPVVIYAHGFNGFKDWGNFDLIAKQFAKQGFTFIKFNFSHNGTTPQQPEDFADLEAYAENNYTKELDDLGAVVGWAASPDNTHSAAIDAKQIFLLGHSRGGGIAILKAAEDSRIAKLVTWASVSECKTPWGNWPPERMDKWEEEGVAYIENSRTQQQMPLKYQLYLDYQNNRQRLDIQKAMSSLQIPVLICHGTADTSVSVSKAYDLNSWNSKSVLILTDSDHVFGRKHPWTEPTLPPAMQEVVDKTIQFFKG